MLGGFGPPGVLVHVRDRGKQIAWAGALCILIIWADDDLRRMSDSACEIAGTSG